jgi:hypothetical protein
MKYSGRKIGWVVGWLGGFGWFGLLSAYWLFQNRLYAGMIELVLFIIAILVIKMTAPWKHTNTKYWKLMLPLYFLFFSSYILSVYLSDGIEYLGLNWTTISPVIPALIPLFIIGNRTWDSNNSQDNSPNI